ncbi:carbohydrate ABC transporter permease [Candidatus Poribacteria bacterium]|nr:carbohydrate ABC transporter permease [Candidatus Poribacteria bacterium]
MRKKIYHIIALAVICIAVVAYLIPIYWIFVTSLKSPGDINTKIPKFIFQPTLRNYQKLIPEDRSQLLNGAFYPRQLLNSIIIASLSTFLAVSLGTLSAYAFSRFEVKGKNDLLFFILSTRMLPPVVVVIPIFLMYSALGLKDTHFGLILLYTTFNISFAVWLMKGFIDEIPKEYEDAALVDGYTRFQAFLKVVLPQATTGIAATSVFCLITAWNELVFALVLTEYGGAAITAPPGIPSAVASGGVDWGQIAAATFIFLLPVAIFTFLMRKHLLRGVTFGAIKR